MLGLVGPTGGGSRMISRGWRKGPCGFFFHGFFGVGVFDYLISRFTSTFLHLTPGLREMHG